MRIISELTQVIRHFQLSIGERTYYYNSHIYDNPALLERIRGFIDTQYNN